MFLGVALPAAVLRTLTISMAREPMHTAQLCDVLELASCCFSTAFQPWESHQHQCSASCSCRRRSCKNHRKTLQRSQGSTPARYLPLAWHLACMLDTSVDRKKRGQRGVRQTVVMLHGVLLYHMAYLKDALGCLCSSQTRQQQQGQKQQLLCHHVCCSHLSVRWVMID